MSAIALERGLSDVIDPRDVPIYRWESGQPVETTLTDLPRTPLVSYYLRRDYDGQEEDLYHLCDEPFDYTQVPLTAERLPTSARKRAAGRGAEARVDIVDRSGRLLWSIPAPGLRSGVQRLECPDFDQPGLQGLDWRNVVGTKSTRG